VASPLATAQPATCALASRGVRLRVEGTVQGVGFRPWVAAVARELGLAGRVWNDGRGVAVDAFGAEAALEALAARLARPELPGASVERVARAAAVPDSAGAPRGFEIAPSAPAAGRGGARIALAPDLATCVDCLAELRDPEGRRRRYPFTSCARCGPRFTLALALPWDRARTTMAGFVLCADCRREHADPQDRRHHAESLACPACGPRLVALAPDGAPRAEGEAALALALEVLRAGGIVALQGLGGFHLACDARSEAAVTALRARKRRERKPLAVMVPDPAAAERLAMLDARERALLAAPERPIAVVRARPGSNLAPSLAPGLPTLGLLLPYTPLHHLLLDDFAGPLVMTSGNRSGEPIAHRTEDALARLAAVADLLLAHDRPIAVGCDDSVAAVVGGAPLVLRRSRGFAPRAVRLAKPMARPVLGVGGHLASAPCLAFGDEAVLGAHVGDLDSPEGLVAFERAVEHLIALAGVRPEAIAHDPHPHYASTRWAREHAGVELVAVQHHHAHLAALLAERGERGPALALAWDGTGLGTDGAAWGGELLVGDAASVERLATFRPLALAGGEQAIRQPWRAALALVEDAFDGAPPLERIPLFARLPAERVAAVRDLLRRGVACTPAHGVGRVFDGIGALVLGRAEATYSGDVALAWNGVADASPAEPYPFALDTRERPWQVDLRPLVREVVADLLAGERAARISARFHAALAAAGAALVEAAEALHPGLPVALTGGCMQNALLVDGLLARLAGRRVLRHARVPAGDGGLALGQVAVADARLRAGRT
jgi:hydrogenase maturation protein HypF